MAIIQHTIERKLSALLGADVSFEKLNLSLLSGSIEAIGVKVGDVLSVARVVGKVAIGRALKGEIVVTSLTIERPVVTLTRGATLSFKPSKSSSTAADTAEPDESRWTFDIEKVLVIDGRVQLDAKDGYRASIEKLLVDLKRSGTDYTLTLLADSVGRRDKPIELGQLRGTITIRNATDLTALPRASAEGNFELGDHLKVQIRSPELRGRVFDITFDGKVDLDLIKSLLP